MLQYLDELDAELAAVDSVRVHLVAVGGAAMLSRLPNRLTGDIDIISEGMTDDLRRACERVASRNGLAPDWINDGAKGMTVSVEVSPERIFTGNCLVVDSAGPRYVLAMKLAAGRDSDVNDCIHLIRELRVRASEELLDLVATALAPRTPPPRTTYWTEQVFARARRGRTLWKIRSAFMRSVHAARARV